MIKAIGILFFCVWGLNAAEAGERATKQEKVKESTLEKRNLHPKGGEKGSAISQKEIKTPHVRALNPLYPRGSIATH